MDAALAVGLLPQVEEWVKMNTAPGIPNRKRKKSDATNEQANAQVKCQNEKRRRELENAFISELANLISTKDMTQNGKKDKCVILQETVNQIKNIKKESSADAVQQGEVSSSLPALPDFQPLLLNALEAFAFFVNSEYRIEYVSENVTEYLKYRREELQGKLLFNYIHLGDHSNISSILVPMIRGPYAYQSDPQKPRSVVCRMLVKNPFENTETMEEKQQRVSEYENMQLSILKRIKSQESTSSEPGQDGDGHMLLCLARKTAEAKGGGVGAGIGVGPAETLITRLDQTGRIVGVETQNLTPAHAQHFTQDLAGQSLFELVWPADQSKVVAHIDRVVNSSDPGPHPLEDVRLRGLVAGTYFRVQTRTKCFKNADHGMFINCIHTICGEEMKPEPASPRSGLLSPGAQMAGPRPAQRPLSAGLSPGGPGPGGGGGGPAPVHSVGNNGGPAYSFSGPVSSLTSMGNTITLNAGAGVSTLTVPSSDAYDSDIFSELFSGGPLDDFGGGGGGVSGVGYSSGSTTPSTVSAAAMSRAPPAGGHMYVNTSAASMGGSRPSSRQSHNSTPTPHPASLPSFSPAGGFQISPPASTEYGRPSPAADADDGGLKGLLGPRSVSSDALGENKESLLQGGLHGHDDDGGQKLLLGGGAGGGGAGGASKPSSGGSDKMLRQLLDERNDHRTKTKNNEELIMLLKTGGGAQSSQQQSQQQQPQQHMLDPLRRPSGGASPRVSEPFSDFTARDLLRGHKRTSQDGDSDPLRGAKKPVRYPSGGGGMMDLVHAGGGQDASPHGLPANNKMLATLLANTSSPSPTVPTTIARVRPSDLPQDKLPRPDELRSKLKDQGARSRGPSGPGPGPSPGPGPGPSPVGGGPLTPLSEGADPMLLLGPGRPQQQQQQPPLSQQQQQQQPQQPVSMATAVGLQSQLGRPMSAPINHDGPPSFFQSQSLPAGDDQQELDNILDDIMNFESQRDGAQRQPNGGPRLTEPSTNNLVNERIAEIRRSLMQAESTIARPAFTSIPSGVPSSAAGFPPPYQQPRPRGGFTSQINMVRSQMSHYPVSNQPRMTNHQMAQRNRLLDQQQQQRVLVNNANRGDINVSYQNIDNILNATPPNVSLQQRLTGGSQESQASPNYSSAVGMSPLGQMPSPGQPPCPSPHSPSLGGQGGFPGYGAGGQVSPRAAPGAAAQPGGGPSPFSAQLSPGGPPGTPGGAQARAAAVAAGKLQQQNPELNAQLSGTFGIRGQSYQLPQRNTPMQRSQQPFPPSPQQQLYQQQQAQAQAQQHARLHRQSSAPPPGAAGMPGVRHYGGDQLPRLLSPPASQSYLPQGSYPPAHPGLAGHPPPPPPPHPHPPAQMDMYAGPDDRVRPPPGSQAGPGGAAGPPSGTAGGGSSVYVRQELRRSIIGQRQQPGGRQLTQDDLEEFGLEVPLPGHDTRWPVQPPSSQPPESPGGAAGGAGGGPPSLLRDLLMSD
ncbi:nuclear receptor coactivator 2-like isoform X2 [Amphibalanus amphitrite]|uniref:nuclear receptor coactivator 2-like isoform X2 n=1 Tax=Amphibalanus amphitrite TaxID=1232801 RepID=UPI001C91B1E4|nr:nuclear receptor coactivator 2-like isoform X2 [Amphibalanus amphitrite]